jgi:nucleotide-binding universal stress UspA family protein
MIQFKHSSVLIPVDFSETSLLAIKHGAFFAQYTKADLYLLHIINTKFGATNMFLPTISIEDYAEIEKKAGAKLDELTQDIQKEYGITAKCIVRVGSASNIITEVAKELNISLTVMGTHGYSPLQELVIGSTALKVFTKAHCPTMAMNSTSESIGYKKIVLPLDNTANTKQKVNYAIGFAKKFNATLQILALLEKNEDSDLPATNTLIHQIKELAKEQSVTVKSEILTDVGNSAKATVKYCEENGGDLLIIMTDQDAELSGFFLGPYAQQIIHLSKVPVIALKPADLFVKEVSFSPGMGTS